MNQDRRKKKKADRLPRGVTRVEPARGGRPFLARIKVGKGVEVHLGLHESAASAALAYRLAARLIGRTHAETPEPVDAPVGDQPGPDEVRRIDRLVRLRLGLEVEGPGPLDPPAPFEAWEAFHEVTVVGFWKGQGASAANLGEVEIAGRRLAMATRLVFGPVAGPRGATEALARLVRRRLGEAFGDAGVTRAVLDDDELDDDRLATWLVLPDRSAGVRGFEAEVRHRYPEATGGRSGRARGDGGQPGDGDGDGPAGGGGFDWASILRVVPPFRPSAIREAYLRESKRAHPDLGGSPEAFVRLKDAYERALRHCERFGESD